MLNNQEMNEVERSLQEMQREFNRISNIIMIMAKILASPVYFEFIEIYFVESVVSPR